MRFRIAGYRIGAASVLLFGTVLVQIAYPLVHGHARTRLAVLIVAGLAATCLVHAATTRSVRTAAVVLAISGGLGFAAELIGVHTGVPFGTYRYSDVLGVQLFGVPLIVALAWTMLAWPSAVVARLLARGRIARVLIGAWALATADVFLDPQLVAAGGWTWRHPSPHLPGVPTVPLTNYAGWLLVAVVISVALQPVVGDGRDATAIGLFLWLWIGWTVAQLFFLPLPASGLWGFVVMGTVALPVTVRLGRRFTHGRERAQVSAEADRCPSRPQRSTPLHSAAPARRRS